MPSPWAWGSRLDDGAPIRVLATSSAGRLVSPNVTLTGPRPALVIEHRYSTVVGQDGDIQQVGFVEVQVRREDGSWGPWRPLQPIGGYPTWPEFDNLSGSWLGRGFFAAPWMTGLVDSGWQRSVFDLSDQPGFTPGEISSATVRFGFYLTPGAGAQGWWIRHADVFATPVVLHDAAANATRLTLPYDYNAIGIAEGIEIPVQVTVSNAGRDTLPGVAISLSIAGDDGFGTTLLECQETTTIPCAVPLAPGQTSNVTFLWRPAQGNVSLSARASIPSTTGFDENPINDRAVFQLGRRITVKTLRDAAVSIDVTPMDGGLSERAILQYVQNLGNVPLKNLHVTRTISRAGNTIEAQEWVIQGPVPPDGQAWSLRNPSISTVD